ncbi:DUF3501 family protein [Sneathiella aquimaris]|uniref:DUF3501 family protein n=1 Tax=Sneathiella aquimaris TaxID=2599305 RepID=UPI00146F56D4|nr:DUF3501 family protein [Sneathiella aquimaris]
MTVKRNISRSDILDISDYGKIRKENKQKLIAIKKDRRVAVGPFATFYFENYDTMWSQIHEMLYIERGGEDQIADELSAYNPLIPQGNELVATFMIEIDDPVRRDFTLRQLGHIEDKIYLSVGGEKCLAVPEQDVERTTEDGKTSAIHFLHFPLSDTMAAAMKAPDAEVIISIEHPEYGHMARLNEATRSALATDL